MKTSIFAILICLFAVVRVGQEEKSVCFFLTIGLFIGACVMAIQKYRIEQK